MFLLKKKKQKQKQKTKNTHIKPPNNNIIFEKVSIAVSNGKMHENFRNSQKSRFKWFLNGNTGLN